MTLAKSEWRLPETVPFGDASLKPLRGGETLAWRLRDDEPYVRLPPDNETVAGWLAHGEAPGRLPS